MLEKYDAHATFFMQGIHVSKYADDVERMKEIGCEIGNHSSDHPQLTGEADGGASQVAKTNELLKQACGQPATVLRPPYGAVNDQVKAAVGMPMILWNIDTLDWKTKDTQSTIDCVLNTADDGDIILTVSYTHLDVYKRQSAYFIICISIITLWKRSEMRLMQDVIRNIKKRH